MNEKAKQKILDVILRSPAGDEGSSRMSSRNSVRSFVGLRPPQDDRVVPALRAAYCALRTFAGTLLIAASFSSSAAALRIVPAYQIVKLEPGKSQIVEVRVHNDEDEVLRITPDSKDWFVIPENEGLTAKKWLKLKKKKPFILQPGESQVVKFKAKAPKKAVGELVGMATFLKEKESQTMLNMRMSVAVYLAVVGTENFDAEILGYGVNQANGDLKVGCLISNKGNVHVRPIGKLSVVDDKGVTQANVQFDSKNPVYPGKTKFVFGTIKKFQLEPGSYKINTVISDADRGRSISHPPVGFELKKNGEIVLEKQANETE